MTRKVFLALFPALAACSQGQVSTSWKSTLPAPGFVRASAADELGNVYLGMDIGAMSDSAPEGALAKYGGDGALLWITKTPARADNVKVDSSGNTYISGSVYAVSSAFTYSYTYCLTKVGADGHVVWSRFPGPQDSLGYVGFTALSVTPAGEIVYVIYQDPVIGFLALTYSSDGNALHQLSESNWSQERVSFDRKGDAVLTYATRDSARPGTTSVVASYTPGWKLRWKKTYSAEIVSAIDFIDYQIPKLDVSPRGDAAILVNKNEINTSSPSHQTLLSRTLRIVSDGSEIASYSDPSFQMLGIKLTDTAAFAIGYSFVAPPAWSFQFLPQGEVRKFTPNLSLLWSANAELGPNIWEPRLDEDRWGGLVVATLKQNLSISRYSHGGKTWTLDSGLPSSFYTFFQPLASHDAFIAGDGLAPPTLNEIGSFQLTPFASPDQYTVAPNSVFDVEKKNGVLANDQRPEESRAVLTSPASHGNLTLEEDGSFTYIPDPGFMGVDLATYAIVLHGKTLSSAQIQFDVGWVKGIQLSSPYAHGGETVSGTVFLTKRAPEGGLKLSVTFGALGVGAVQEITVPDGAKSATFGLATLGRDKIVFTDVSVKDQDGLEQTARICVTPPGIAQLVFNPATLKAGQAGIGTVNLKGNAGPSGLTVTLYTANPGLLTIPPSLFFRPGQSSVAFRAVAGRVTATAVAQVYASDPLPEGYTSALVTIGL